MKEIISQTPTNQKRNFIWWSIVSIVSTLLALFLTKYNLLITSIVFIASMGVNLSNTLFDNRYDGWTLGNDFILLSKMHLIKGLLTQNILYKEINEIVYFKDQTRNPSTLQFVVGKKSFVVLPKQGVYKLAGTLKYFQNQGIKVRLASSDYEVELYLKGKIDSLPMTNDMKIND